MNRRDFVVGMAVAGGMASGGEKQDKDQTKLGRIGVMTLSFNPVLKSAAHPDDPKRTLDILDTAQMVADRFGIRHIEVQHAHFASTETSYLRTFRERVRAAKSQISQICLEFGPLNISVAEPVRLLETIDLTKRWIDHAAEVGCPRVMVNQGTLAPEVRQSAIAALKTMGEYGKSRKVFVTMENRGRGGSSAPGAAPERPAWEVVVEVIKAAGIWANPDVGNFPDEETRAAALPVMYPMSCGNSHVHYDPTRFNEANALSISKKVNYSGLYSIEAVTANGPDPYAAVQMIVDELLKDI